MTKFTADVHEYLIFRADFKHAMESRYSKRDSIAFLCTCLQGHPLDLIKGIGFDYDVAWDYLDCLYGDPCLLSLGRLLSFAYYSMVRMHDSAILCTWWSAVIIHSKKSESLKIWTTRSRSIRCWPCRSSTHWLDHSPPWWDWDYLDCIYGDPCFMSDTVTQDIVKFRPP